ncbi:MULTISPECIES: hypothetical protein [Brevibacillus]|nr:MULTISPECIES: hypothetical protein [Brevibacillus]MCG7316223.1 hypothetical protein [Brevibacillus laterosporus]
MDRSVVNLTVSAITGAKRLHLLDLNRSANSSEASNSLRSYPVLSNPDSL